jgi:sugar phosphate isomerase/epimerase
MARKETFMARWLMLSLFSLLSLSVAQAEDAVLKPRMLAAVASEPSSTPKFYAYCIRLGVPGVTPLPLTEQVKLLCKIGFDGIALELDNNLDSNLRVLDDAGLQLYMVWVSIRLTPGKDTVITPGLSNAIIKLKGRPTTICVLFDGIKPGDPQGIAPAVNILRKLGNLADAAGIRISIYNHVGNWTESLPFVIDVVRKTTIRGLVTTLTFATG